MKHEFNKEWLALLILVIIIGTGIALATKFTIALIPLLLVFIGIIFFRLSGAVMAVIGLLVAIAVAVLFFRTDIMVSLGALLYGIFKSFGITIAVLLTMLMIFLMKEAKALDTISEAVKRVAKTKEEIAIFIGVGFCAFVTSLGVVSPSLLPPFLMALGFDPFSSISISVLGQSGICSYSLLAIPITIPSDLFKIDALLYSYRIALYLPVVSMLVSFAVLFVIGGKESIKKGWILALASGLCIGISVLIFSFIRVPILILGVIAGLLTMLVLYFLCRKKGAIEEEKPLDWKSLSRALSPWLIVIIISLIISVPDITKYLKGLDGPALYIYGQAIDFDVLIQIYTWILVSTLISIPILGINGPTLKRVTATWMKRLVQPFLSYSLFFGMATIMSWSAMGVVNGKLAKLPEYNDFNMNVVIANTLFNIFGGSFIFVAVWLGVFGAVVGGSEASSNVMFYQIQKGIADKIWSPNPVGQPLSPEDSRFLTNYGAHAAGGGVASAITPSKINNAAVTIGQDAKMESDVMRKHLLVVILITIVIGILNGIFIMWSV